MTTFDHWGAMEDVMTPRFTGLVVYLVPLAALGSGVALASPGPAIVADGIHPPAMFCSTDSSFAHRGTIHTYSHIRIAQFGHCHCGGYDENGHCNHQVCD
jgi:hypothetical protein